MAATAGKRFVLAEAFDGGVKETNFRLEATLIPAPNEGGRINFFHLNYYK